MSSEPVRIAIGTLIAVEMTLSYRYQTVEERSRTCIVHRQESLISC